MRGGIPTWSSATGAFAGFQPINRPSSTAPRNVCKLSGAVAKTKEGRAVNRLKPTVLMISANNERGQRGPWPKRPRRIKRASEPSGS